MEECKPLKLGTNRLSVPSLPLPTLKSDELGPLLYRAGAYTRPLASST